MIIFHPAVPLNALECSSQAGERRFPPSSCITFQSTLTQTNSNAHTSCSNGGLATVEADGQFETLLRYTEVLLSQGGSAYWLGYMYNSSSVLLTVPDQVVVSSLSPVLDPSNYDSTGQQNASDVVCIAVGVDSNGDAKLYRRMCNSTLPYICAQAFTGECVQTTVFSGF